MILTIIPTSNIAHLNFAQYAIAPPVDFDSTIKVIRWDGENGVIERDGLVLGGPPFVEEFIDVKIVQHWLDALEKADPTLPPVTRDTFITVGRLKDALVQTNLLSQEIADTVFVVAAAAP